MAAKWNPNKAKNGSGVSLMPQPLSSRLMLVNYAQKAIEELIDNGGYLPCTKAQFALRMGWTTLGTSGIDAPNRSRVEDVCNLTRDQEQWPEIESILGGLVIVYSPSQGGMCLVDPTGEQPLDHLLSLILGDLQKQQAVKTMLRRRVPTWQKAGDSAANSGDTEMAGLCWQALGELKANGTVSDTAVANLFKAARSRGLLGTS